VELTKSTRSVFGGLVKSSSQSSHFTRLGGRTYKDTLTIKLVLSINEG